jgi:hypothetical protein
VAMTQNPKHRSRQRRRMSRYLQLRGAGCSDDAHAFCRDRQLARFAIRPHCCYSKRQHVVAPIAAH